MKIAHVIRALDVGGAERVTAELASSFAEAGHSVTIFAGWPTDSDSPAQRRLPPSVHVEYIQDRPRSRLLTYMHAASWVWKNRARLQTFDVLHCHLTYGAVVGTLVHSWRGLTGNTRPRLVETYHSVGAPISAWTRQLHALLAARRDTLVLMASDTYWSRFARSHSKLPVKFILNGTATPDLSAIPADARDRYRAALGIPERAAFVVGSVGMLRADRHPDVFIPVIVELVRELGDDFHWIFAGDGEERPRLERLVADAGVAKNVHFAGLVKDVRYPLSLMRLHFTITVRVVGGVASIESALAGVPVIGFQLSADYRASDQDWIWSSNRAANLAAQALRLLRDADALQALATMQRQYALEHHSVEQMTSAYREIYLSA
jgi:glycosyltransferase involved in cell wall biosynthesis